MATPRNNTRSNQGKDKEESLKYIIEEQKRDYDYLLHIYNRMRATESVLLTATFGIIAYLYYGSSNGESQNIFDRLFVPSEEYGTVIYLIAIAFFGYGLFKLMLNVFGNNPWMTAYEAPNKESLEYTTDYKYKPKETLEYMKARYDTCLEFNGERYNTRKEELKFLFYSILISAIILIVIKTLN